MLLARKLDCKDFIVCIAYSFLGMIYIVIWYAYYTEFSQNIFISQGNLHLQSSRNVSPLILKGSPNSWNQRSAIEIDKYKTIIHI